jgi:hypothetical protein
VTCSDHNELHRGALELVIRIPLDFYVRQPHAGNQTWPTARFATAEGTSGSVAALTSQHSNKH